MLKLTKIQKVRNQKITTVPSEIADKFSISKGDTLIWKVIDGKIVIEKAE